MEKYKDMSIRKKSNIKMIRNLVLFVLLIIFTFWFVFKDQDINEFVNAIKTADLKFVLIGALLMFLVYMMETINVRAVLVSLGEKKFSLVKAFKYTTIGAFFSAITPAATGGQPVEIYYMSKDGIKTSNGTMAMLMQLCGFQISSLALAIICGILNPGLLGDGILWFYLLGLLINGFALIVMLLATFSNKATSFIYNFLVKIMEKTKVKNIDRKKEKLDAALAQYAESSKYIKSHKIEFVKSVLRVFVQMIIYHSIPYFIYKAFGLSDLNFLQLFSMQAVLYTTVSGLPLPGAIGVSETLFLKIYGSAFGKALLSGAMILYRFVSFYLYIIIFAVVVVINAIKSKNIECSIDKDVKEIDEVPSKHILKEYA